MKALIKAVNDAIAGNIDNAARHRMQGTEFDLKMAKKYEHSTVTLLEELAELKANMSDEAEAEDSMENEGGITP